MRQHADMLIAVSFNSHNFCPTDFCFSCLTKFVVRGPARGHDKVFVALAEQSDQQQSFCQVGKTFDIDFFVPHSKYNGSLYNMM